MAAQHSKQKVQADADPVPQAAVQTIRVRVLALCAHGQPNDVVEIEEAALPALAGIVDADPAAVAYAESLKG